jgi:hypothetical protein
MSTNRPLPCVLAWERVPEGRERALDRDFRVLKRREVALIRPVGHLLPVESKREKARWILKAM